MELLNSTPLSVIEIRTGTRCDPILSEVIKYVQQGWPNHSSDEALQEALFQQGRLIKCSRWMFAMVQSSGDPPKKRARVVEELHESPWNLPYEGIGDKLCVVANNGYRLGAECVPV